MAHIKNGTPPHLAFDLRPDHLQVGGPALTCPTECSVGDSVTVTVAAVAGAATQGAWLGLFQVVESDDVAADGAPATYKLVARGGAPGAEGSVTFKHEDLVVPPGDYLFR